MYSELIPLLRCPNCHSKQLVAGTIGSYSADGELLKGTLVCPGDGSSYPIRHGVADLLGPLLPPTPAQVVNMLPLAAWAYERTWRFRALSTLSGEPFGYRRELPLIAGLMEPARSGLYLDVACSSGLYARALALARAGSPGHVVGIDHSLPMLREAGRFARSAGLRISFVRARAQALPFAQGAAAGVAMGGSLNEIGDLDGCLQEMRRVLAPAGRCVLMSLVQGSSWWGRSLQQFLGTGGVAFLPLDAHNQRFQAAGLRLTAQWRYRVVVFSQLIGAQS